MANFTFLGMTLYSILSLGTMASMSVGAWLCIAALALDSVLMHRSQVRQGLSDFYAPYRKLRSSPMIRKYICASGFLVGACLLSLLCTVLFPLYYAGRSVSVHVFKDCSKMIYFLFPLLWVLGWQRLNQEQRRWIVRIWFITFAILSGVGIVQFFTGWPRAQGIIGSPGYYHAVLFMGHHLSVASVWIFPFFALLDVSLNALARKSIGFSRFSLMTFIALGFTTLILTYARTLWAALPVGFMVLALGKLNKKTAMSVILFLMLSIAGVTQTPYIQERWKSTLGTKERVELWKANFQFLQERPFLGVGFGKNQELSGYYFHSIHPEQSSFFVGHAHNLYLELLAGIGMFGTLCWFIWVRVIAGGAMSMWRKTQREISNRTCFSNDFPGRFPLGVLCAGVVFLINAITQVNFWEGKVLHQVMWVVGMVLAWVVDDEQKSTGGGLKS